MIATAPVPDTHTRLIHLTLAVALAVTTPPGHAHEPTSTVAAHYRLPVTGDVLRLFDPPPAPWARGHRGVDIAAPAGGPIRAPGDGVVAFSGYVVDRGVISIDHPDGLRSSVEPVIDALAEGTPVRAGDVVAYVATDVTHCAGSTCAHWGVRRGQMYIDPLSLIGPAGPVVLLAGPSPGGFSTARPRQASNATAASPRCASARSGTR